MIQRLNSNFIGLHVNKIRTDEEVVNEMQK